MTHLVQHKHQYRVIQVVITATALLALVSGCSMPLTLPNHTSSEPSQSQTERSQSHNQHKQATPKPNSTGKSQADQQHTDSAQYRAQTVLRSMSRQERIGQLIMAPLFAGSNASQIKPWFDQYHIGSVLLLGNWNTGVQGVAAQAQVLQTYAHPQARLFISADQEGGAVQHLRGVGFDRMPTAVQQGQLPLENLRAQSKQWGLQLAQAGVNLNLAPVAGTVSTSSRQANAPIGMYDRDFGLDPSNNGAHAAAFIEGMHDAGVLTAVKHFPGLGAITGNTDFTADSIVDTTTTLDNTGQMLGFTTALQSHPDMVMMSLATYANIDAAHPAALSHTIVQGYVRDTLHFQGVITSDSMSAAALASIPAEQLGTQFIEAGGDLLCIGASEYVAPIAQGLIQADSSNPEFTQLVDQAALRVLTLKAQAGLLE